MALVELYLAHCAVTWTSNYTQSLAWLRPGRAAVFVRSPEADLVARMDTLIDLVQTPFSLLSGLSLSAALHLF